MLLPSQLSSSGCNCGLSREGSQRLVVSPGDSVIFSGAQAWAQRKDHSSSPYGLEADGLRSRLCLLLLVLGVSSHTSNFLLPFLHLMRALSTVSLVQGSGSSWVGGHRISSLYAQEERFL